MTSGYGKKEEVYGFQTLYREIAYYLNRLEQYEKSLRFFEEAIKKTPNDRRALMGRAYVRSKCCEYQGALLDIGKALDLDPHDLTLLGHKALNTYLSCEFEAGLIQNTRLLPKRRKPDVFFMGINYCTNAIENCVGTRAGHPLRDHYKIIRNLAWIKNFEEQKPFEPKSKFKKKKKKVVVDHIKPATEPITPDIFKKTIVPSVPDVLKQSGLQINAVESDTSIESGDIRDEIYSVKSEQFVQPPNIYFPYKPLQNYTSNLENYMGEKYLEKLNRDKIFLKRLINEPGIVCPNKAGTDKILKLSKIGYKAVNYKQELLRIRRPFYFIKYQEAKSTGLLKVRQLEELKRLQKATKREADAIVAKMQAALDARELKLLMDYVEKLRCFCELKPKKIFPEREEYQRKMYGFTCQGYFDIKRLNKRHHPWEQRRRIYVLLGLPLSREPSRDSVVAQFKDIYIDWKKMAQIYGDALRKATTPEEMAWLYHELSRFHLELKQYELSRVYARKCITEAKRFHNLQWIANAMMQIIKGNVMQHNKNDAKSEANAAIEFARDIDDQSLAEFFEACLNVIEGLEFDDVHGPKILQKREEKIVEIMAGMDMKSEVAHLFRKMSAMPAARRMSVMPGVRLEEDKTSEKMAAHRMSIKPAKTSDTAIAAPSKSRGAARRASKVASVSTQSSGKGVGFMELIQYHIDT